MQQAAELVQASQQSMHGSMHLAVDERNNKVGQARTGRGYLPPGSRVRLCCRLLSREPPPDHSAEAQQASTEHDQRGRFGSGSSSRRVGGIQQRVRHNLRSIRVDVPEVTACIRRRRKQVQINRRPVAHRHRRNQRIAVGVVRDVGSVWIQATRAVICVGAAVECRDAIHQGAAGYQHRP
jgi:hypothetical protein